MQLLLIDNRVNDVKTVTDSLLENVDFVIVDFNNDTHDTLISKISVKTYDSVGIFQENYETNSYQYISTFTNSVLTNVSSEDPNLDTWSQFKSLLTYFKNTLQINTLDLMGCSIYSNPDWNYVIEHLGNQLQISINSSSDKTGSANFGGNWILESSNTDLIGKYFSNNITNYKFVLGIFNSSSVVLTRDYKLYSCGDNPGTGIFSDVYQTSYTNFVGPSISSVVKYFASVATDGSTTNTSFLLHADGSVSGTGLNTSGQLGIGPNKNYVSTFTNIYNPSINSNIKCVDLDCGSGHTILLLSDGSIWGTGLNTSGQLGTGNNTSINTFTRIYNPINNGNLQCTGISCGDSFTLYVLSDGSAWGTGLNANGQLGTGNNTTRNTFIKTWNPITSAEGDPNIPIKAKKVKANKGIVPTSFLLMDGVSTPGTRAGSAFGTGVNTSGQLGIGNTTNRNVWTTSCEPWQINGATNITDIFINTVNQIFVTYLFNNGYTARTEGPTTGILSGFYYPGSYGYSSSITQIETGYSSNTTVVLQSDGIVAGLSLNNNGQLGLNNTTNQTAAVQIYNPINNSNIKCVSISTSGTHVVLVLENGSVRAAGLNSFGQLGDGTRTTPRRTFLTTYDPSTNSNIACVKAYAFPTVTILLMANGTLRTTGTNALGQLGIYNGINTKLSYTYINNIEYISIGSNGGFSVILYKDGSVWGKGDNDGGEFAGGYALGNIYYFKKVYDPTTNSNRKCINLCTNDGYGSTTLLLDNGSVMFTGYNAHGQVALGYNSSVLDFQHSYNPANNSNIKCIAISSVNGSTYILLENGLVRAVGNNQYGQFGIGTVGATNSTFTTIYNPSNGLTCRSIHAEDRVGFLILSDGSLWGTGRNDFGQLGLGNTTQQTSFIKIYDPTTNSNVQCVSCISRTGTTLILLSDGSVRATGLNTNGQMGLGNTTNRTSFVTIYNPSTNLNVKCRAINLSEYHSQLLLTDGTVLVAGLNDFGQLGNGTYTQQLSFVKMLNSDGTIMTDVYRLNDNYCAPIVIPVSPTITSINSISPSLQNPTIKINFTQTPIDATITNYSYSSDGITYTPFSPAQYTSPLTVPVSNLTNNSSYTFSIKAINDAGSSTASTGVSATIYFPPEKPSITSIVAYNGIATVNFTQPTTSVAVTNYAYSYSINGGAFTEFTLCNPVKTTSPLTITGLVNNKVVSVRIRGFNDNNSVDKYSDNSNTMSNVYVYSYEPIFCFKDNTKILTNNGYFAINELRKGVLIKTFEHGFKPITVIGKTNIKHEANQVRIPDQLYTYKQSESNNLNEDLVITGRHAILVDDFVSDEQKQDVIKLTGIIQKTDNKLHLPACVDNNSTVYETPGQYTVYHLALESEDKNTNYGIYANGLLVEACCEKYLESRTTIEFIE